MEKGKQCEWGEGCLGKETRGYTEQAFLECFVSNAVKKSKEGGFFQLINSHFFWGGRGEELSFNPFIADYGEASL